MVWARRAGTVRRKSTGARPTPHNHPTHNLQPGWRMRVRATLPDQGRDLRLDLFRGLANWLIFLGHIPNSLLAWFTTRNYGFSDGADLFVLISGYTATFVFGNMMMERGFVVGATRL